MEDCKELKLYTRKEAAKKMSISYKRLNDLIAAGKLEFIKIGNYLYIPYLAILKFIQENSQSYETTPVEQQFDNQVFVNHPASKKASTFDSVKYVEQLMEEYIG